MALAVVTVVLNEAEQRHAPLQPANFLAQTVGAQQVAHGAMRSDDPQGDAAALELGMQLSAACSSRRDPRWGRQKDRIQPGEFWMGPPNVVG